MSDAKRLGAIKKIDKVGVGFMALLAAIALGAIYAALHFGWFHGPWELAGCLFVGLAFVAVGFGVQNNSAARNTKVHGDARPAGQDEAKRAARGETGGPKLSERQFKD